MKYSYAYKTSDGVRHVVEIEAKRREDVFAELRQRGIKPIKVVAADGSKENGEVRGIGKGVFLASIVLVAVLTGGLSFLMGSRQDGLSSKYIANIHAKALPRQTIPGDRRRVNQAKQNAFSNRAEYYLAQFSEPGRSIQIPKDALPSIDDFKAIINSAVMYSENEMSEEITLKRIVVWIKREMADYICGGGRMSDYLSLLTQRQNTEIEQRSKAERRLNELLKDKKQTQAAYDFWLKANAQLQGMGIYPLPFPDDLKTRQLSEDFN